METQMTPGQLKAWFDSEAFEQQYHTEAPLGAWLESWRLKICMVFSPS